MEDADDEDAWHTLVHVCRQWRHIVFSSPRHLGLQLLCTPKRPAKKMLDLWPELPIIIYAYTRASRMWGVTNIIAALKEHNRVYQVDIDGVPNSLLKKIAMIKKPFPELTDLALSSGDDNAPVLQDSFLGGSAPRLRQLFLKGIPFPTLPKLLLSTRDLVVLRLWRIPHSGYISPDVMVSALSLLTRLETLHLRFRSPRSLAERESQRPPPLTRIVLPSLTSLWFRGDSESLEDIVARVDTPLLDNITIVFFNQLVFDTPLLRHFITRTKTFETLHRAHVVFARGHVSIMLLRRKLSADIQTLHLAISCKPSDWQLSSLAQVCFSSLLPLPNLEYLGIQENQLLKPRWQHDIENTQWRELLLPFTSVKELALSEKLVQLVAPALQDLAVEGVTAVLPTLKTLILPGLWLSSPVKEAIERFIAARQRSGCPVAVPK